MLPVISPAMSELPAQLRARGLQDLGWCTEHLPAQASRLIHQGGLLEDFLESQLHVLGAVMRRAQAAPGQVLIAQGELGDWLLLVLSGSVDVTRQIMRHETKHEEQAQSDDPLLETARLAVVRAGSCLGEMSLFDQELRLATCTAIDDVVVGVLTRSAIGQLIKEQPAIAAKLLVKITQLLAQRLRQTSAKLVAEVASRKHGHESRKQSPGSINL